MSRTRSARPQLLIFGASWAKYPPIAPDPTWPEILGERVGLVVENFAVSGSPSRALPGQLDKMESALGPGTRAGTVALVNSGGNNISALQKSPVTAVCFILSLFYRRFARAMYKLLIIYGVLQHVLVGWTVARPTGVIAVFIGLEIIRYIGTRPNDPLNLAADHTKALVDALRRRGVVKFVLVGLSTTPHVPRWRALVGKLPRGLRWVGAGLVEQMSDTHLAMLEAVRDEVKREAPEVTIVLHSAVKALKECAKFDPAVGANVWHDEAHPNAAGHRALAVHAQAALGEWLRRE